MEHNYITFIRKAGKIYFSAQGVTPEQYAEALIQFQGLKEEAFLLTFSVIDNKLVFERVIYGGEEEENLHAFIEMMFPQFSSN